MKQNYDLYNSSISAGITTTLDGIEKKYFLGDSKKISQDLPNGELVDPYNIVFHSKILKDNQGRKFRIKGKCDALIRFSDGSSGIIDFKTSKFPADMFVIPSIDLMAGEVVRLAQGKATEKKVYSQDPIS